MPNNPSTVIPLNDMKNPKLGMLTEGRETPKYSQSVNIIILTAHDVRQVIWAELRWAMDRTVFKFIDLCKEASTIVSPFYLLVDISTTYVIYEIYDISFVSTIFIVFWHFIICDFVV